MTIAVAPRRHNPVTRAWPRPGHESSLGWSPLRGGQAVEGGMWSCRVEPVKPARQGVVACGGGWKGGAAGPFAQGGSGLSSALLSVPGVRRRVRMWRMPSHRSALAKRPDRWARPLSVITRATAMRRARNRRSAEGSRWWCPCARRPEPRHRRAGSRHPLHEVPARAAVAPLAVARDAMAGGAKGSGGDPGQPSKALAGKPA